MHVADVDEVLLALARRADRALPLVHELENLLHRRRRVRRRPLGEPPHELVEELLGADLEVERVAAVLDEDVEELRARGSEGVSFSSDVLKRLIRTTHMESEHGDVRVAVVDEAHDLDSCLSGPARAWSPSQSCSHESERNEERTGWPSCC